MATLHVIFTVAALGAVGYYVYLFYTSYQEIAAQPGEWEPWERLWAAGKGSATKLWARVVGVVAAALTAIIGIAPMLGSPEVTDFIKANFEPQTVTILLLAIMAVVEIARNRTT